MIDLIKEALNEHFSDYKKYQIIILVVFTLIIAAIQILQSIWVSRTIEKFKTALKKSEIKFSRYHDLQVEALKNIYLKLVNFHAANRNLFNNKYDANNHTRYKNGINSWITNYIECINEFSKEKILLPERLKILVQRTITDFNIVKEIIENESEALENLEEEADGDWNVMYDFAENEVEQINNKILKLKANDSVAKADENIIELRVAIEKFFEEMNTNF